MSEAQAGDQKQDAEYRDEAWLREHHNEKDMNPAEIADKAGVSPGTIRYHLGKCHIGEYAERTGVQFRVPRDAHDRLKDLKRSGETLKAAFVRAVDALEREQED